VQGRTGLHMTLATSMAVTAGDYGRGPAVLASVGPPSSQSVVFTDRAVTSGATRCVGTSGDGCVHSEGTQNFGQLSIGGLPLLMPVGSVPLAWQGYFVRFTSYSATAKAEVGKST